MSVLPIWNSSREQKRKKERKEKKDSSFRYLTDSWYSALNTVRQLLLKKPCRSTPGPFHSCAFLFHYCGTFLFSTEPAKCFMSSFKCIGISMLSCVSGCDAVTGTTELHRWLWVPLVWQIGQLLCCRVISQLSAFKEIICCALSLCLIRIIDSMV